MSYMPTLKKVANFLVSKRYWLMGFLVILILGWVSGFLTGWWRAKGTIGFFPNSDKKTKLLVIAPHPDDEVLIAGGLIQQTLKNGGEIEIVFLTNGDGSRETVLRENKKVDFSPQEYLALGEQRRIEAINADTFLGVKKENLIFLGFPDRRLINLYSQNYTAANGALSSPATKFNHVPYQDAYRTNQSYLGENLTSDLKEIIADFKPTLVVTTHLRDLHPDHRAAYLFVKKIKDQVGGNWQIYTAVVHFRGHPEKGDFLIPPKKLFGSGWVSFNLTDDERRMKLEALKKHQSQYANLDDKVLFERFSAKNEIFEVE